MKKKKTPIWDYFCDCTEEGKLLRKMGNTEAQNGLCFEPRLIEYKVEGGEDFIERYVPAIRLFRPSVEEERKELIMQGLCTTYWASDMSVDYTELKTSILSPTRQNIILLIAAMKGEL